MEVVYFLLPLALLLVATAAIAFRWACQDGQFDDLETPALRILFDDEAMKREMRSVIRQSSDPLAQSLAPSIPPLGANQQ